METQASIDLSVRYATFPQRVGAVMIDFLILLIPGMLVSAFLPGLGALLLWLFYAPVLEASRVQATIGKRVMGIYVARAEGGVLSLSKAILRGILKCIGSAFFFIPHFFALFTPKNQALHDLILDSVVLQGLKEGDLADSWIQVVKGVTQKVSSPSVTPEDKYQTLEKLQALLDKGTISREEFEAEKKKILG